jgi:hypothetical protein
MRGAIIITKKLREVVKIDKRFEGLTRGIKRHHYMS